MMILMMKISNYYYYSRCRCCFRYNLLLFVLLCRYFFFTTKAYSPPLLSSLSSSSQIRNTRWRINLDVGLEEGSRMFQKNNWKSKNGLSSWGRSGARLGVGVVVCFTDEPFLGKQPRENKVLKSKGSCVLRIVPEEECGDGSPPSSVFVSSEGIQRVAFSDGGWSIQGALATGSSSNKGDYDSTILKIPWKLLTFWLDCTSGAKRNDIEIPPNTRIFCTIKIWDNTNDENNKLLIELLENEKKAVAKQIQETTNKKQKSRQRQQENRAWEGDDDSSSLLQKLQQRKKRLEQDLPPSTAFGDAMNHPVKLAPKGTMFINGNSDVPDWFPGSVDFLTFGTFSAKNIVVIDSAS